VVLHFIKHGLGHAQRRVPLSRVHGAGWPAHFQILKSCNWALGVKISHTMNTDDERLSAIAKHTGLELARIQQWRAQFVRWSRRSSVPEGFMTQRQVISKYGLSAVQLKKMLRAGLPSTRDRSRMLINVQALEKWLDDHF